MSPLLLWSVIFVLSLAGLVKASDYFIDASEKIGLALGLPSFIVGVTLIATGTSLPELISSVIAVHQDASEIVVGNVIGSNITNICFVLGVVAIWSGSFKVDFNIQRVDMPILTGSAFLMAMTLLDYQFSLFEAFVSIGGLIIYISYIISVERPPKVEGEEELKLKPSYFLILALSATGIYFGAKYNVESIIKLSGLLGIGKEVIALTAVALGTSLPELVVSIVALKRGNHEMVIGNVLGSNIFNSLAVMGIPALVGPLTIPEDVVTYSLPMMLVATLLYFFITLDREVNRWEGMLLMLFYVLFIGGIISSAIA